MSPQRAGYYSFLTVREALEYYATLHDLSTANRVAQVEAAMREVCLHIHATRRVSTLSPSLVQRLGAGAITDRLAARAILLDETLSGRGAFSSTTISSRSSLDSLCVASRSFLPHPIRWSCIESPPT